MSTMLATTITGVILICIQGLLVTQSSPIHQQHESSADHLLLVKLPVDSLLPGSTIHIQQQQQHQPQRVAQQNAPMSSGNSKTSHNHDHTIVAQLVVQPNYKISGLKHQDAILTGESAQHLSQQQQQQQQLDEQTQTSRLHHQLAQQQQQQQISSNQQAADEQQEQQQSPLSPARYIITQQQQQQQQQSAGTTEAPVDQTTTTSAQNDDLADHQYHLHYVQQSDNSLPQQIKQHQEVYLQPQQQQQIYQAPQIQITQVNETTGAEMGPAYNQLSQLQYSRNNNQTSGVSDNAIKINNSNNILAKLAASSPELLTRLKNFLIEGMSNQQQHQQHQQNQAAKNSSNSIHYQSLFGGEQNSPTVGLENNPELDSHDELKMPLLVIAMPRFLSLKRTAASAVVANNNQTSSGSYTSNSGLSHATTSAPVATSTNYTNQQVPTAQQLYYLVNGQFVPYNTLSQQQQQPVSQVEQPQQQEYITIGQDQIQYVQQSAGDQQSNLNGQVPQVIQTDSDSQVGQHRYPINSPQTGGYRLMAQISNSSPQQMSTQQYQVNQGDANEQYQSQQEHLQQQQQVQQQQLQLQQLQQQLEQLQYTRNNWDDQHQQASNQNSLKGQQIVGQNQKFVEPQAGGQLVSVSFGPKNPKREFNVKHESVHGQLKPMFTQATNVITQTLKQQQQQHQNGFRANPNSRVITTTTNNTTKPPKILLMVV